MVALTDLGVAAIRDGFRSGDFSAREVAEAFNSTVEKARGLNAFVIETPDGAPLAIDSLDSIPDEYPRAALPLAQV